jgi:hypothetical protein
MRVLWREEELLKHSEGTVEQCIILSELIIMLSDVTWRYDGNKRAVNKWREVNQTERRVSCGLQVGSNSTYR